ncbi:MAG: hypothetical protein HY289_12980 [Planctomycetes bacterium]|nr:hypothetical protein [Planctomycetota bacterium]
MSYHVRLGLRTVPFVIFATLFALCVPSIRGQEKKLKQLEWSHAFDLACRKNDEKDITKDTKRWGVEAFRDNNTGVGIGLYVSETGCMGLTPNFAALKLPLDPSKPPAWLTGLDMPARKAGVNLWKGARIHSMEVFRDPNADNWLYITDAGNIGACSGKGQPGRAGNNPKWIHSVDLSVRKGGVKEWKDAAKFGVEVYKDGNTNNLVYVSETGAVAIIQEETEVKVPEGKGKAPEWLHGLDLSCRKFDEKSFTKDTRKFGVEVYNDVSTGHLVFISETGSIAVTPAAAKVDAPTPKAKEPLWTHGLNVKARKFGEKDFSDKTRVFGAEVFLDENISVTIYINELGNIAVLAAK